MGEGRLEEVQADERCEPKPVLAVEMRQEQAGEDECSGKPADEQMHFHME